MPGDSSHRGDEQQAAAASAGSGASGDRKPRQSARVITASITRARGKRARDADHAAHQRQQRASVQTALKMSAREAPTARSTPISAGALPARRQTSCSARRAPRSSPATATYAEQQRARRADQAQHRAHQFGDRHHLRAPAMAQPLATAAICVGSFSRTATARELSRLAEHPLRGGEGG